MLKDVGSGSRMKCSNWSRGAGPGRKFFPKCCNIVWICLACKKIQEVTVFMDSSVVKSDEMIDPEPANVQGVTLRGQSVRMGCFTTHCAAYRPQCSRASEELLLWTFPSVSFKSTSSVFTAWAQPLRMDSEQWAVGWGRRDMVMMLLQVQTHMFGYLWQPCAQEAYKKPTSCNNLSCDKSLKVSPRWGHTMPSSLPLHQVQVPSIIL